MTTIAEVTAFLRAYGGLSQSEASALANNVSAAAQEEALDVLAGQAITHSSLSDQRAMRLRYICLQAGRMLARREVELIFRVQPTTAAAIVRRMQALYPADADNLLSALVETAEVFEVGGAGTAGRHELIFSERSALEQAERLLDRRGTSGEIQRRISALSLEIPTRMTDRAGKQYDPLKELKIKAKPQRRP
jgi:hypothetical protein